MTPTTKPRRARKSSRASFGSVRRLPSGRYQARYSDARMNRYTAPQTFATKKQAEDWLATTRADMVRGTWRAPELSVVTLTDYATDHLSMRLDLAASTRALYGQTLRNWLATPLPLPPAQGRADRTLDLGAFELGALSVTAVREWFAAALHVAALNAQRRAETAQRRRQSDAVHQARAWARQHGHQVKDTGRLPRRVLDAWHASGSPTTALTDEESGPAVVTDRNAGRAQVAQAYRLLHMILEHAVREGRIDANPCQIAGAGQVRSPERVPATPAQIDALAQAMPERYAAAVHVAAWSGLRAGELFGLSRRHVDLDAGTVRVDRAVTYLDGCPPQLGSTKTDSSRRTVYLPPHVVDLLRAHMTRYTRPGPDALVFTDPGGGIVSKELRKRTFHLARASIGRPDLRWHDLRHTGATIAAHAGASLRELQHRLGHSTVAAAMIYQHHSAERDRDLAQRMSSLRMPPPTAVLPSDDQPEADRA